MASLVNVAVDANGINLKDGYFRTQTLLALVAVSCILFLEFLLCLPERILLQAFLLTPYCLLPRANNDAVLIVL